jgi:prepilin-type N-terminal cleavage/methylation domain-containing protein
MKKAFTLIELMVVVMVLGIVAAVIVPNFSVFMKGNRMRLSVKSVILAGKYAKSIAVLRQRDTAVIFDFEKNIISVDFAGSETISKDAFVEDGFVDFEENDMGGFETIIPKEAESSTKGEQLEGIDAVERKLEDGIVFDRVDIGVSVLADDAFGVYREGVCRVVYYTNGRCEPYTVVLKHDSDIGQSATMAVDALGFVETTYEE